MKRLKFKLKLNKNNKLLWIILGIILVIILVIIILFNHMTKLEKDLLTENSNEIMLYMDSIEESKDKKLDSYILYALEYGYNEQDKEKLTAKEIKKIIENIFNIKVKTKDINLIGITPLLLDKGTIHNPEEQTYEIVRSNITQRQIADIPIVTYKIKSMKKHGSKYIIKYQKVTIKNPYEILNYYSDLNSKNIEKEKNVKMYDTSKIMNYLTAKGKIKDVKLAVNDELIKKEGKIDKKLVKIIYKLKGTKFVVDKVK